jgi:hypothetical protein
MTVKLYNFLVTSLEYWLEHEQQEKMRTPVQNTLQLSHESKQQYSLDNDIVENCTCLVLTRQIISRSKVQMIEHLFYKICYPHDFVVSSMSLVVVVFIQFSRTSGFGCP